MLEIKLLSRKFKLWDILTVYSCSYFDIIAYSYGIKQVQTCDPTYGFSELAVLPATGIHPHPAGP